MNQNWPGVYLMQDGALYKIGRSVGIYSRLSQIQSEYPGTAMHSYVLVPPGMPYLVEIVLPAWAYANFRDRAGFGRGGERGDWFALDEAGVVTVQTVMQVFYNMAT